jgi:small subunit ribosomal protein S1
MNGSYDDTPAWAMPEDESYWSALLAQGEVAFETPPRDWNGEGGRMMAADRSARLGAPSRDEWILLKNYFDDGVVLQGRVIGCNRGGLLVRINDIVGFVPASQLSDLPRRMESEELRIELEQRIGQELDLKLIELDRTRNRIILSERAAAWTGGGVDARLAQLAEGDQISGRVRSICHFGAFVDLGGIDGLIHISELSWQRVAHPSEVVGVSQDVDVLVMNVDRAQRRVALSLKRLRPDPWETVEQRYAVGQFVTGVVTNVVDFGAFVRIEDGLEGLIHISELAEGTFLHPRNVVQENTTVTMRVLNIDSRNRRLGLSLRQAYQVEARPNGLAG